LTISRHIIEITTSYVLILTRESNSHATESFIHTHAILSNSITERVDGVG